MDNVVGIVRKRDSERCYGGCFRAHHEQGRLQQYHINPPIVLRISVRITWGWRQGCFWDTSWYDILVGNNLLVHVSQETHLCTQKCLQIHNRGLLTGFVAGSKSFKHGSEPNKNPFYLVLGVLKI